MLIEIVKSQVAVQIEQQCRSRKSSSGADRDSRDRVAVQMSNIADRKSRAAVLIEIVEIELQS